MSELLAGRVVALIGAGSARDRAIAVALAEAGANIAIATEQPIQEQEFATASIANEVWAIGREQFSAVIDASDDAQMAGFLAEVRTRLGRLDAIVGSAAAIVAEAGCTVVALRDAPMDTHGANDIITTGMSDGDIARAVVDSLAP